MINDLAIVIVGPGITEPKYTKYGKWLHISTEPLLVLLSPFLVPKASPIQASKIGVPNLYTSITLPPFQEDFSLAISKLVNSGIYQKIERDITTVETAHRELFDMQWVPEQLRSTTPFTIDHALPSFIALGTGLILATLVWFSELCKQCKNKSKNQVVGTGKKPNTLNSTVGSHPRAISEVDVPDTKKVGDLQNNGKLIYVKHYLTFKHFTNEASPEIVSSLSKSC